MGNGNATPNGRPSISDEDSGVWAFMPDGGRRAVVDIGSNSVRLVVYEGPRRAPYAIVNEKTLCGLGRDMSDGGSLNPAAVESALLTLRRIRQALADLGHPPTHVIATAAVREATDGAAFVAAVRKLGFDIRVIDGNEEARLAALGVASLEPGAAGIVGDMGGGSLELVALENGEVAETASLSIGPLRIMEHAKGDLKVATKEIAQALEGVEWLRKRGFRTLYSVGGAWRAIARINMQVRNYPLPILHHYDMPARQAVEICELIARQSRSSLIEIAGVASKRLDTLPYASLVLKGLIERARVARIFISAGGVREGILYDRLSPKEKRADPLFAGATFLAERLSPAPDFGVAAAKLTDKLFADEAEAQQRLRRASCQLIDIGAYFHPDLRGREVFDTALRAQLFGITHAERVAIALSLFVRHEGNRSPAGERVLDLLSDAERERAVQTGLALRFVAAFSPRAGAPLNQCALRGDKGALLFTGPAVLRDLMTESSQKKFEALAAALGLEPAIRFDS